MLRVVDKERFAAAKAHARKLGLVHQFAQVLRWLQTYANHKPGWPQVRVTLSYDFAPHSFSILWERRGADGKWSYWFSGGLIFHGPHDRGGDGGAPTFSVNLTPQHGWSVHT